MRLSKMLLVTSLTLATAAMPLASQGRGNAVTQWNRLATEIFSVDVGPLLDARALAILHAAIHDAVNGIERRYEPYTANLSAPDASVDATIASAAREVMIAVAPGRRERIEQAYAAALAAVPDGPAKDDGVRLGERAARANLDRRSDDGITPGPWPPRTGPITEPVYVPTGKPGDYAFTPPFDAPPLGPIALFPGFGHLRPFAIDLAHHHLKGPDPLNSQQYARDFATLKSVGRRESTTRTRDQTNTALFWFEQVVIWNDIARSAVEQRGLNPWQAARVFALVSFAMIDGFIASFDAKYHFRFWRPYTAIRHAAEDGNDATEPDSSWIPLLWPSPGDAPPKFFIPPIPEYPSAAAVPSAAVAEVLQAYFGDKMSLSVTSTTLPGVTREFSSFTQAAREAGMSRVYGGIHFLHSVEDGWKQGASVGRSVTRMLPRAAPMRGYRKVPE